MHLCNTNDPPRIHTCQRQAIDEGTDTADMEGGHVFRIGVLIPDDCSLSDIGRVLAKTCERFGAGQRQADNGGKISVTLIADRSGFVLRGNASIPVWCEAIGDVNPEDYHCFVAPQRTAEASALRPEINSQLARREREERLILLSLDTENVSNADDSSNGLLKDAAPLRRTDAVYADRREAVRIASDAVRAAELSGARRSDQLDAQPETPAANERIKATIKWLDGNYGSRVSVKKMAERALMSERNFLRRFKAEVGLSPHEYLCRIRLEIARQLLVNTALPVDKIARHCGLFNGNHLRKHFLKHFGMTPGEYRSAHFNAIRSLGCAEAE